MRYAFYLTLFTAATPVLAANTPVEPRIAVLGRGAVSRMPDLAVVGVEVRGDGKTPEAAIKAMADNQERVEAALGALGVRQDDIRSGSFGVSAEAPEDCDEVGPPGSKCGIVGHVATQNLSVEVRQLAIVGDVVAAAARAGAMSASIKSFRLQSPRDARKAATAAAVADARSRAETIAQATGGKVGSMLTMRDTDNYERFAEEEDGIGDDITASSANEIIVSGARKITLRPEMIITTVNIAATFAVLR